MHIYRRSLVPISDIWAGRYVFELTETFSLRGAYKLHMCKELQILTNFFQISWEDLEKLNFLFGAYTERLYCAQSVLCAVEAQAGWPSYKWNLCCY